MSRRLDVSARWEAAVVASCAIVWIVLWQFPHYLWLPIPPYRDHPGAPFVIQTVAYVWAALLLLLPFLLPFLGAHLAFRQWPRRGVPRHFGIMLCALAIFPAAVVGFGILWRVLNLVNVDSAEFTLFYWWPR